MKNTKLKRLISVICAIAMLCCTMTIIKPSKVYAATDTGANLYKYFTPAEDLIYFAFASRRYDDGKLINGGVHNFDLDFMYNIVTINTRDEFSTKCKNKKDYVEEWFTFSEYTFDEAVFESMVGRYFVMTTELKNKMHTSEKIDLGMTYCGLDYIQYNASTKTYTLMDECGGYGGATEDYKLICYKPTTNANEYDLYITEYDWYEHISNITGLKENIDYVNENSSYLKIKGTYIVKVKLVGTTIRYLSYTIKDKVSSYPSGAIYKNTVVAATQNITLNAPNTSFVIGGTSVFSTTGNKTTVTYSSSNTSVATVDSKTGKVTAKAVGTAKITATAASSASYNKATKSVTIKVLPKATSKITLANTTSGVKITWAKVTGATGYYIYRGSTLIKKITSGSTVSYTDTGAKTNGGSYSYKIVPFASVGNGASATKAIKRITTPSFTSIKNPLAGTGVFTWKANSKATGYEIVYKTASTRKTVTVYGYNANGIYLSSLKKGTTYSLYVRTFITSKGVKYYSAWSPAKTIKITK